MAPVIGTWCLATFRYKKPWRSLQGIVAPLAAIPSKQFPDFVCVSHDMVTHFIRLEWDRLKEKQWGDLFFKDNASFHCELDLG